MFAIRGDIEAIQVPRQAGVELRWYQKAAIEAVERIWQERSDERPLVVLPTGSGKGYCCAEIARRFVRAFPGKRAICAIMSKELVEQNYISFRKIAPDVSAGIYSASVGRKDRHASVTFANIQSIWRASAQFRNVGLLIVDEAHFIDGREGEGMFQKFISALREMNPALRIVGLTATGYRLSSGSLVEPYKGSPPVFTTIAFELTISELLAEGYLAPLIARSTSTRYDVKGVSVKMGEFAQKELNERVNTDKLNASIVTESIEMCADRRMWLCFAVSVDHAMRLRDLYRLHGISCEMVSGETPKTERERIVRDFKDGRIRCLVNCAIFLIGFDAPGIDAIIMAQPTRSPGRYVQAMGRAMRPAPGKTDALICDFAGVTLMHGLVDRVRGVFKRQKDDPPEVKEFPRRMGPVTTAADREAKLSAKAVGDRVMTQAAEQWWSDVSGMRVSRHDKNGRTMMRVTYIVQESEWGASDFLMFDDRMPTGEFTWAAKKAQEKWRRMTISGVPPATTAEALARQFEIRQPRRVLLQQNGQYLNIAAVQM